MKRLLLSVVLLLARLTPAAGFEPKDLVGEWTGEWKTPRLGDAMYITIKKVDNKRVEGTMYIRGPAPYHNRDIPFVGTIDGTTFSTNTPTQPGQPPIQWSLEVNDEATEMTGVGIGTVRAELRLTKKRK
jgi:hypothetical protein